MWGHGTKGQLGIPKEDVRRVFFLSFVFEEFVGGKGEEGRQSETGNIAYSRNPPVWLD